MKKQKEFELHKKIRGPKWYLRPIEMVGAWIFAGPFGTRTKIKKVNCEGLKGPFILLSNHASFVDFANDLFIEVISCYFTLLFICYIIVVKIS